jgi:hypothetical protein
MKRIRMEPNALSGKQARVCSGMLIEQLAKTNLYLMGKDREGNFHPSAGKPSALGKQTENIVNDEATSKQLELEDKYGIDPDTNKVSGIKMAHPNRNADKDDDRKRTENAKRDSDKSRNETLTEDQSDITPDRITDISKELLEELFSYRNDFCISFYLPTHRTGLEVNELVDPTLFKNILQRTGQEIASRDNTAVALLEPGYELLRNKDFWESIDAPGIAFFISRGFFKYILLPEAPAEQFRINRSFLISPLVPYLTNREYFYLLVISKKQSKLFRVERFSIRYIPIPEMPNGVEDVVHLEEKGDQKLFRTGSSGGGGGANYHGMESGMDDKENIAMYLAEVDSTIRQEVLRDEHVPLLLAGVDYLIPIFKKATHYNNVWDAALTGNHEYESEQMLHKESLRIMQDYFDQDKKKELASYGDQSATERTSSIPDDVIRAAFYSRVRTLFIGKDAQLWGTFDEQNDKLELHDTEQPGDENLADKTVMKTVLNGGAVFMLDEHEVPQGAAVAAIMRY